MVFTDAEREYLGSQWLARLATVDGDGRPQNNPVRFFVVEDTGTIEIWGMRMGKSRKFRNAGANPAVAVVIDDIVSTRPWRVRGIEIRGRAETLTGQRPPYPYYSREVIRVHPERIISWGVESDRDERTARDVET
jgi:pyridoxamine 5'-phosphate oxidase family protein